MPKFNLSHFADQPMLVLDEALKVTRVLIITLSLPGYFCLEMIYDHLKIINCFLAFWLSIGNEFPLLEFCIGEKFVITVG